MKRHEASIRVITTFFAALVGFGLKGLLDGSLRDVKWPCFVLSILLFLRYHIGSGNHLWYEYVRDREAGEPEPKHWLLLKDFAFLVLFGGFALWICYSAFVQQLLGRTLLLLVIALAWVLLDVVRLEGRSGFKKLICSPRITWGFWFWINLAQLVLGGTVWALCALGVLVAELDLVLWPLAVVYLLILVFDVNWQFEVLKTGSWTWTSLWAGY